MQQYIIYYKSDIDIINNVAHFFEELFINAKSKDFASDDNKQELFVIFLVKYKIQNLKLQLV